MYHMRGRLYMKKNAPFYFVTIICLFYFLLLEVCPRNLNLSAIQMHIIKLNVFAIGLTIIFIRILLRFAYFINCRITGNILKSIPYKSKTVCRVLQKTILNQLYNATRNVTAFR